MSDGKAWFSLPTGRKLEQPDHDPNYIGSLGPLRAADEGRLRLARRTLRELPEKDVEGQGLHLVDKSSGEEFEVITSFVDLVDPKLTGATAFVIRDGWLVPLRPRGWKQESESHYAGTIGGSKATGREPMPISTVSEIF